MQIRRLNGDIEQLHGNAQRLRDVIEYKERQCSDLEAREKQAQAASQQSRGDLKVAKDEIKKLSSLVLNREGRYNHEAKKKDQELARLKERLLKAINEAKQGQGGGGGYHPQKGMSIEFVGQLADKADGQGRGRWRTETEDQKRGDDLLQKVILANQERNEFLAKELHNLQEKLSFFFAELSRLVGQDLRLPVFLPSQSDAYCKEWTSIKVSGKMMAITDTQKYDDKEEEREPDIHLSSFVPL